MYCSHNSLLEQSAFICTLASISQSLLVSNKYISQSLLVSTEVNLSPITSFAKMLNYEQKNMKEGLKYIYDIKYS